MVVFYQQHEIFGLKLKNHKKNHYLSKINNQLLNVEQIKNVKSFQIINNGDSTTPTCKKALSFALSILIVVYIMCIILSRYLLVKVNKNVRLESRKLLIFCVDVRVGFACYTDCSAPGNT